MWQGCVISIAVDEGPVNVIGSLYSEVGKFLGQELRTTMEITEFMKNEKWSAKVIKGPLPYEVSMIYLKVPEGTKLTTLVEGAAKGFFKLAEVIVTSTLEKTFKKTKTG